MNRKTKFKSQFKHSLSALINHVFPLFAFARFADILSLVTRSSAMTARRAMSVEILSTVGTSCTANPQQIEVIVLEHYG